MKKRIIMYGWLVLSPISLLAQEITATDVPVSVKNTLKNRFPKAIDIDWKKMGNQYEASFDLGKVDHDAVFTRSGQLLSHDYDIPDSALPTAVKTALTRQFPGYRLDGADKREEGGRMLYKVELDGTPDLKVLLTADGKVVKKITDKD